MVKFSFQEADGLTVPDGLKSLQGRGVARLQNGVHLFNKPVLIHLVYARIDTVIEDFARTREDEDVGHRTPEAGGRRSDVPKVGKRLAGTVKDLECTENSAGITHIDARSRLRIYDLKFCLKCGETI
jgi:hypothetical protein